MGHVKEIKLEQICSIDIRDFGVGERHSCIITNSFSLRLIFNDDSGEQFT